MLYKAHDFLRTPDRDVLTFFCVRGIMLGRRITVKSSNLLIYL